MVFEFDLDVSSASLPSFVWIKFELKIIYQSSVSQREHKSFSNCWGGRPWLNYTP